MSGLALEIPEGFVVLDAADPARADLREVPATLAPWYNQVVAARVAAGAELLALRLEPSATSPDALTAVSLAVDLRVLQTGPTEVVVQGLRALALARTTTAGEVSVLDLPLGPAVGSADVVEHHGAAVAVVTLHLPLPRLAQLLTLTVSTPDVRRVAACASLAAMIATRLRLDPPEAAA